jgi:hypothetical protein
MVHPDRDALKLFVRKALRDAAQVGPVEEHLAECDFCRDYCELLRAEMASQAEVDAVQITDDDRKLSDSLFQQAMSGRVIALNLMTSPSSRQVHLAADGAEKYAPAVTNLATLYSEDPELVLRVMRDSEKDTDYLQLIGAHPELTAHVMIRIPEISREYVTDAAGRAIVPRGELGDAESLKWEIKLPDARFELRPMIYDPEHVESLQEVTLETGQHDRVQVTFASKTAGKQILIKVLELDGVADFGSVRVSISQQTTHEVRDVAPHQVVPFAIIDPNQEINIRLYR